MDQDFALVISGDHRPARRGLRPAGSHHLHRAGRHSAVGLRSRPGRQQQRERAAQKHHRTGGGKLHFAFRRQLTALSPAAVATVPAPAALDGKLEIHNGDAIEADYVDSFGITRTATASADLVPPVSQRRHRHRGPRRHHHHLADAANRPIPSSVTAPILTFNLAADQSGARHQSYASGCASSFPARPTTFTSSPRMPRATRPPTTMRAAYYSFVARRHADGPAGG